MTAADPLARVRAMVTAYAEPRLFDSFYSADAALSTTEHQANRGFQQCPQFLQSESCTLMRKEDGSELAFSSGQERTTTASSRVESYSRPVETVETVEITKKDNKNSIIEFCSDHHQPSKNKLQLWKDPVAPNLGPSDAGLSASNLALQAWASGVARLADMPTPAKFPAARWVQVTADAETFLQTWAAKAHQFGWQDWELFGCHRQAPWHRIQGLGLIPLLQGDTVVALTSTEAAVRTRTGAMQTFRRRQADPLYPAERCLIWELDHG